MSKKGPILRWLRGVTAVLILAALVCLGYQCGHKDGYDAVTPPPAASSGQLKIVTYSVGDLVIMPATWKSGAGADPKYVNATTGISSPDFDSLIDLIVATIDRESWMENGTGEGEIMPFPTNLSLVISQTSRVHEHVADLLEQLRGRSANVLATEMLPLLQSYAAYGTVSPTPSPFVHRTLPDDAKGRAAMLRLFQSAQDNLTGIWGVPEYRGKHGDEDFPAWSTADQIAIWPRAGGLAYVAVQGEPKIRKNLVTGWRRSDK